MIKKIKDSLYKPKDGNPAALVPISAQEAIRHLQAYQKLVIKPTESNTTGLGKDIAMLDTTQDSQEILSFLSRYKHDYIIQEYIHQHPYLANFNPDSVNTFRITTLLYKGKIHTLPSVLYIGRPHKIASNDNSFRIGIDENGVLRDFITDSKGGAIHNLPNCTQPYDPQIPHFGDVLDMAKDMHARIPHLGLISWEFSLDAHNNQIFNRSKSAAPHLPKGSNFAIIRCLGS